MKFETTRYRFTLPHQFGVDPTTGNLTGLQLLAAGREAKGHGIYIDEQTLATAAAAVAARGGRLKAYVTHNHAGMCSWDMPDMDEASSELNIPGFFSGIAVQAAQLVAAQFEFYDAFKKNFAPQYEQLLEMAKKTPDLLGLSIECWGYLVYVAKDGTEYSAEPADVELLYNGLPALRVTDLWAAAFVSEGAATDGLFAKLSAKFSSLFGGKPSPDHRRSVAAALAQFAAEYGAAPDEVPVDALSSETSQPDALALSTMKIIAALKTKITDPARFAAAMTIVGNTPEASLTTLTVAEVETQLSALDLTAARADVTRLTGELATATASLATLATERDQWKTKFENLKKSGKADAVDLGAESSGGGSADEANPWHPETRNLTRQAQILKTDPARAAALKAAAASAKTK